MKNLLLFLSALLCTSLFSQTGNTVLWKISGNGLDKPSYLYGTVHLTDKRVFYTNDSLREYIFACDYFASELHPDSLNALMFGEATKDDTSDVYRNTFNYEDYKRIDNKLKNDLGINLKQIKSRNFRGLKMLLNPHKKRQDDYPTFLDGYLMGIAKRKGKTLIGLEGIGSHEKAFSALQEEQYKKDIVEISKESKEENSIEKLIKTYLDGDLGEIEKNYSDFSYDAVYDLLDRRNKIMAETIDSIVKTNTLFATCGAAHLVGENGIIKLLRKKGYTVTPILAKKKSYLNTNDLPVSFTTWKTVSVPELGVNYSLPGLPGNLNKGVMLSDMKTYIDISSGIVYFVFPIAAVVNTNDKQAVFDKYTGFLTNKAFIGATAKTETVRYKGMEGSQTEIEFGSNALSCRLFLENNIFYIFCATHPTTVKDKKEIDYFFENISIYKPAVGQAYHYKNDKWAFEMDLPVKPLEQPSVKKERGVRTETLSFRSSDNVNGVHYILEASDIGMGMYIPNDSIYLRSVYNGFSKMERMKSVKDTSYLWQGCKCTEVRAVFDDSSCAVNYTWMRGYKYFNVTCVMSAATERQHTHEAFLNSFHFLPLADNTFKEYPFPGDSALVIRLPQAWSLVPVDTLSYDYIPEDRQDKRYVSYDRQTSLTYYLQKSDYGKYYYEQPDSVQWKDMKDYFLSEVDSMYSETSGKISGIPTHTYVYSTKGNTSLTKYTLLDMGSYSYNLSCYFPPEKVYDQQDIPFEHIAYKAAHTRKVQADTTAFRLLESDYNSEDSTLAYKARNSVWSFSLTDAMFDDVRKVLDAPVKMDTTGRMPLKYYLIPKLQKLHDTAKVLQLAKEKIGPAGDTLYTSDYLNLLADIKTEASYNLIKEYMSAHTGDLSEVTSALYTARDSLQLGRILLPEVLRSLKGMDSLNYASVHLISSLLREKVIRYADIIAYEPDIIALSSKFRDQKGVKGDLFSSDYNNISAEILKYSTNVDVVTQHFTDLTNSKNIWCRYYGNYYLAETGKPMNAKVMKEMGDHPYFRYKMYTEYKDIERADKIPAKYLTNEMLSEGNVYYSIVEFDESMADKVNFIKKIETTTNDKPSAYYLYKVHYKYDESKTEYLYAAGPYFGDASNPDTGSNTGYLGTYEKGSEEILFFAWQAGVNIGGYD
jgi:uncharacterized protein YbaP (TraB family)